MSQRYIAFDVETPNYANDRISAIGITVIESGAIAEEYAFLVNPETEIAPYHTALTGITAEMVAQSPTFPVLWETIGPFWTAACWWPIMLPLIFPCWGAACGITASSSIVRCPMPAPAR